MKRNRNKELYSFISIIISFSLYLSLFNTIFNTSFEENKNFLLHCCIVCSIYSPTIYFPTNNVMT